MRSVAPNHCGMSKIFTLLFVLLAFAYISLLRSFAIADEENPVNQKYRQTVLKSGVLRKLFFLNRPGDSRYEYFSPYRNTLLVEVDFQAGRQPNVEVKDWIRGLAAETIRKDVRVEVSQEEKIGDVESFSDEELRDLAKATRDFTPESRHPYMHVMYVSTSGEYPSNTGLVLTDQDVFIFQDRIKELSDQATVRKLVEVSTIKHELGHLLGLEHVDREDCVMSELVEVYHPGKYSFESIPTEFCEESLQELQRLWLEAR